VTHKHDETKQGTMALVESDLLLYLSHMKSGEDPDDFMQLFKAQVNTINAHGGQAGLHPRLVLEHYDELVELYPKAEKELTPDEVSALTTQARKESCEGYLSCLFIRVADNERYKGLKTTLDNQFLLEGNSAYPRVLSQALKLLKTSKSTGSTRAPRAEPPGALGGVAFIQQGSDQCFSCGKKGHHAHECPSTTQAEKDAYQKKKEGRDAAREAATAKAKAKLEGVNNLNAAAAVESEAEKALRECHGDQDYLDYQQAMGLIDDGFGMVQVGISTEVVVGTSLLSPTYPKESHPKKNVSFADVVKKSLLPVRKAVAPRLTLDKYKLYLDSCATYHTAFWDQCFHDVCTVDRVLKGNCNAGVVTSSEK